MDNRFLPLPSLFCSEAADVEDVVVVEDIEYFVDVVDVEGLVDVEVVNVKDLVEFEGLVALDVVEVGDVHVEVASDLSLSFFSSFLLSLPSRFCPPAAA